MEIPTQKPKYRIEFLTWAQLEDKFNSDEEGFYWCRSDESNK